MSYKVRVRSKNKIKLNLTQSNITLKTNLHNTFNCKNLDSNNILNVSTELANKECHKVILAPKNVYVKTKEGRFMIKSFSELIDVDVSQVNDKYVIMYDSSTRKYTAVNPDEVLAASANTETIQPGLPETFIDTLDVDLDNKIDLDAGEF